MSDFEERLDRVNERVFNTVITKNRSYGSSISKAATLLLIEKLTEVAGVQAQAIKDLPIEKVVVWDGGRGADGEGGLSGLGGRLIGALPPMHDLAKQVGLELPEFLGRIAKAAQEASGDKPSAAGADQAQG